VSTEKNIRRRKKKKKLISLGYISARNFGSPPPLMLVIAFRLLGGRRNIWEQKIYLLKKLFLQKIIITFSGTSDKRFVSTFVS